jgi:hypothetical protein
MKDWSTWFANGWYTWSGWANEVAGVVHKWEWVAPKWMVNSMKPLFDSLEGAIVTRVLIIPRCHW